MKKNNKRATEETVEIEAKNSPDSSSKEQGGKMRRGVGNKNETESPFRPPLYPSSKTTLQDAKLTSAESENKTANTVSKFQTKSRPNKMAPKGTSSTSELKAKASEKKRGSSKKSHDKESTENEDLETPKIIMRDRSKDSSKEIMRIVQETKEREERIKLQLLLLRDQAKIAAARNPAEDNSKEDNKDISSSVKKCESQLDTFKHTINNILEVTKQTHNEIQRTRDIVSNIQNDTTQNRICGSCQSKFIEDDEREIFEDENGFRSQIVDKHGMQSQNTPLMTSNEEEAIKCMFTNEDGQEGIDEVEDLSESIGQFKDRIKYYEKKVLQTESERLEKEKENLLLKESIAQLKRTLNEKDRELHARTKLSSDSVAVNFIDDLMNRIALLVDILHQVKAVV